MLYSRYFHSPVGKRVLVVRRLKAKKPVVLTIGHSTHTWNDFRDLLRAHRVKRVVDVRSIPGQDTILSSTGRPFGQS